jgi:hypothetical protein
MMGAGRAELAENLRASLFNEGLWNDTTFSQIHLDVYVALILLNSPFTTDST